MNVVLYTYDLEPIGIVSLPWHLIDVGLRRNRVVVPVREPMCSYHLNSEEPKDVMEATFKVITVVFETLYFREVRSCILLTHDEVTARLLESRWPPTQREESSRAQSAVFGLSEMLVRALS